MSTRNVIRSVVLSVAVLAAQQAHAADKTRTEHDLLGDKQIPRDAYYGVQTARALENFQFSDVRMNTYPEFVKAYAMVKVAAARGNNKTGSLEKERLEGIEKAGEALISGKYLDQFR